MYAARYPINYAVHRFNSLFNSHDDKFIVDFKDHVLSDDDTYAGFSKIDAYRSLLYNNNALLEKMKLGAGSRSPDKRKTIGETARITSVNPKYGRLLYRIVRHFKPDCIIELGSSFGISTMYLALGNSQAGVITVEGNPQVAGIAEQGYTYMGISNITMFQNSFDQVVPDLSHIQGKSTLVFIDGNHTMEATLEYYGMFRANTGMPLVLIFDDINWSTGMMKAWKKITSSVAGETCIDLFQMGIVFAGYRTVPGRYYLYY